METVLPSASVMVPAFDRDVMMLSPVTVHVEGDSDYTITVGSYQDSADTFVSTTVDDWSSYEVERPESL